MFRNSVPRGFKKYDLSTNVDGFENQKVLIEKIPDYHMILANDKLNKEYTFYDDGHDPESNDDEEVNHVENKSGKEYDDTEVNFNERPDN